jgi:hypothetical protein
LDGICDGEQAQLANLYPKSGVANKFHFPPVTASVAVAVPPLFAAAVTVFLINDAAQLVSEAGVTAVLAVEVETGVCPLVQLQLPNL